MALLYHLTWGIIFLMPELPEVETVVNSLRPFIEGKSFTHVQINHPKSFLPAHLLKHCLHTPIISLHRHGKMIVFAFANDWYLLTHLKMTGQLIYAAPGQLAGGGHPSAAGRRRRTRSSNLRQPASGAPAPPH